MARSAPRAGDRRAERRRRSRLLELSRLEPAAPCARRRAPRRRGGRRRRPSPTAARFSLDNLPGEQQSIQSWPGKPLLINFWATWCGPCLREIPMLKELQAARPDLQVVGIAIDKPRPRAEFADDMQFNYPS